MDRLFEDSNLNNGNDNENNQECKSEGEIKIQYVMKIEQKEMVDNKNGRNEEDTAQKYPVHHCELSQLVQTQCDPIEPRRIAEIGKV